MTTEADPSGGSAALARSLTMIGGGGAGTLTAALAGAPWWAVVGLGFVTLTPPAVALVLREVIPQEWPTSVSTGGTDIRRVRRSPTWQSRSGVRPYRQRFTGMAAVLIRPRRPLHLLRAP